MANGRRNGRLPDDQEERAGEPDRKLGLTRSQAWPANLNEARRALVNPDLRSIVLSSEPTSSTCGSRSRWPPARTLASMRRRELRWRGRLFVVDHTLIDDFDHVFAVADELVIRPPFDVTPIFVPGFEASSCPLFVVMREAQDSRQTGDCDLRRRTMKRSSGSFRVSPRAEDLDGYTMIALLTAIRVRKLKPIRPPR